MQPERPRQDSDVLPHSDPITPRRILAATDLGPVGESTLRVAHARACASGARLAVCHVIADAGDDTARRIAEVYDELTRQVEAAFGPGAHDIDVFVPVGDPARQIDDCAEAWSADLVVIGRPEHSSGVLARLFRPGLVDKVLRWSPCAVLVSRRSPGTGRIVVGTDFSDPQLTVLRTAAAERARGGGAIHVIHCLPPSAVLPIGDPPGGVIPAATWDDIEQAMRERIEENARDLGLDATVQVIREAPADGLIAAACELAADLVIVGAHQRGRLARLTLGSVAQKVVNEAPCPVLVVRL